jgi:multidrug resistance efflux pump
MPLQSPKVRTDLKYQADPKEQGRFFVKDPLRGEFFRYNALQVAMMRALDGKRTLPEVQRHLATTLGVEVPDAAIARFVDRLERALLLDVTSYRVDDAGVRRAIRGALRKRGLAWRVRALDEQSPEATFFEAGMRLLNDGDPCLAASYLEAVLEVNPSNERAGQILDGISEAFFKSKIVIPSHVRMKHLWNPDRFLAAVDRRFGAFLFSRLGIALLALFVLTSVIPAIDVIGRPRLFAGVGFADVPLVLLVFSFHIAVHELSHGLACKHHGGTVDDLGLLLMYGVIPGAYCDVSESYLFAERWHKIQVQLAGVFGHMVLQAGIWHVLNLTDPSFPLWTPLLAVNLYVLYSNIKNLIPLAKFDGYYALAELLGLANLRERSFAFLKDRLGSAVLGLPAQISGVTARERRIFLAYGIAACGFTACMLYFLFISFLLPKAVDAFGTAGLVLAVVYIAQQIVWRIVRAGARLAILVARKRELIFTRRRCAGFAVAVAAATALLSLPWPLHVEGDMLVEPRQRAHVRAEEPGLVEQVRVREGDRVGAGQVIATLRADELVRDRAVMAERLAAAGARLAILRRGTRDEEIALARAGTAVEQARFRAAAARLDDVRKLHEIGAASESGLLASTASASRAGGALLVSEYDQALVRAGARSEDIAAQDATVRRLEAELSALEARLARCELRSPIAGVVVTRRPDELRGRWVAIGDEVLEVHDVSEWRVRIAPDLGEPLAALEAGQRVDVRARGEPHATAGGRLDAIRPPDERDAQPVLYAAAAAPALRSGMTGRARIYVPSRSIAYRVIALPLVRIFDFDLWRIR